MDDIAGGGVGPGSLLCATAGLYLNKVEVTVAMDVRVMNRAHALAVTTHMLDRLASGIFEETRPDIWFPDGAAGDGVPLRVTLVCEFSEAVWAESQEAANAVGLAQLRRLQEVVGTPKATRESRDKRGAYQLTVVSIEGEVDTTRRRSGPVSNVPVAGDSPDPTATP